MRSFDANVPARSKIGNALTRRLFSALFGVEISDTQTGLRAIPRADLTKLLAIPYNRYNYEFEALIRLVKDGKLAQHPIATVYEPGNPSSHFNPFLDSARIYAVFARHLSFVFVIGVVDWLLFTILTLSGYSTLHSLLTARAITIVVYFAVARKYIFHSHGNPVRQGLLFLLLVAANILLLLSFISQAHNQLGIPKPLAMLIGHTFLFVSNFLWQNFIVFKQAEGEQ